MILKNQDCVASLKSYFVFNLQFTLFIVDEKQKMGKPSSLATGNSTQLPRPPSQLEPKVRRLP